VVYNNERLFAVMFGESSVFLSAHRAVIFAMAQLSLFQDDVTPLKLASVVNNYDVMRLLMNNGGRLTAAAADDDAAKTLDHEGHDGQLSRIAYMVLASFSV